MSEISIDAGKCYNMLKDLVKSPVNIDDVIDIIKYLTFYKMIKFRHIKLVIPYFHKLQFHFEDYYKENIKNNLIVDNRLISFLIDYPKYLNFYIGQYVKLDEEFSEMIDYKYDYSRLLIQIFNYIKNKYSSRDYQIFLRSIPTKSYDMVFDGNNILFSDTGKITEKSYIRLTNLVKFAQENGYNPIVFIHIRNIKYLQKVLKKHIPEYIYSTPYNFNDDWISIFYAVKNNCNIVSNDLFRDHINEFDTKNKTNHFKIFLDDKKLPTNKNLDRIIFTNNIIPIIIRKNDKIYIPGISGYKVIL